MNGTVRMAAPPKKVAVWLTLQQIEMLHKASLAIAPGDLGPRERAVMVRARRALVVAENLFLSRGTPTRSSRVS